MRRFGKCPKIHQGGRTYSYALSVGDNCREVAMKKSIRFLLLTLTLLLAAPVAVYADIGPKPSVVIRFEGLGEQKYYATLLSKNRSTGPYSALDSDSADVQYTEEDADFDIFLKFSAYKDDDGFYFLQYFQECTQSQTFSWTYYPPQDFKILLYFPDAEQFVVSETAYSRYAFDSYFTAVFTDSRLDAEQPENASLNARKSYDYTGEAVSLVLRILLTLAIELGIAVLFGFYRKGLFRFIVIVNLITQIILNILLNWITFHSGPLAFRVNYVLLELLVFVIEAFLYTVYTGRRKEGDIPRWKPAVYALTANAASFAAGLFLADWIPRIF